MAYEPETKPYRDKYGIPMNHADFWRRELEAHGRKLTARDFAADKALICHGMMLYTGDLEVRDDGSTFVNWDGDVFHHDVSCDVCGFRTSVATDYKRLRVQGAPTANAAASSW